MAVTEAEVKRLLAEATGKPLLATRLLSLDRLRAHLARESRRSAAMRAAADGLLRVLVDAAQPTAVRARCADVLEREVGDELFRTAASSEAWPSSWTERFVAVVGDDALPVGIRVIGVRALEARVLEEPGLERLATRLFLAIVGRAEDSVAVRAAALAAASEMHRSVHSFLADQRRAGSLRPVPLAPWAEWRALDAEERELTAALVDPMELDAAVAYASPEDRGSALEATVLHVRRDPSSARSLSAHVRRMLVDHDADDGHAEILRAAATHDRARGALSLAWIAPAIVEAVTSASRRALATGTDPRLESHVQLWNELFRDGARGLVERLLCALDARTSAPEAAASWVALHALGAASEAAAKGVPLLRGDEDVLVGLVLPERVGELQETGVLRTIDVPTAEEHGRLDDEDVAALPRRVRLARVAEVLARGDDASRTATALALLPGVVRWLPCELARFEPLVRALFAGGDRDTRLRAEVAFDALVLGLDELGRLPVTRRSPGVRHLAAHVADIARAASMHGHSGPRLARAILPLLGAEQTAKARAFWLALVRSRDLVSSRRLDAFGALSALAWPEQTAELGALLEEVLTRDDPAVAIDLVEAFYSGYPARFVAARLRVPIPTFEQVNADNLAALAAAVSPEETLARIEASEPVPEMLGAMRIIGGVVERRPDLRVGARAALAARIDDLRSAELQSIAGNAFDAWLGLVDDPEEAVAMVARVVSATHASLDGAPRLRRAREVVRRFADVATPAVAASAAEKLDRALGLLLARPTRDLELLASVVDLYRDASERLRAGARFRETLERTMNDRRAPASARWVAFERLGAVDAAVAAFLDPGEDAAYRALLGGIVTIAKPAAFESLVDMNVQPWTLRRVDDAELPASSLPANMPSPWLVTTLRMADHDDPHHRATLELAARLVPLRPWEWPRTRATWLELVGAHGAAVRRGLRAALERRESLPGRHAGAARLLVLFGDASDEALLAGAACASWSEETLPDDVFWRPAGKAPAFGRHSFIEPQLEAAFGTEGRYRILGEAYALEAERAEARGEGGNASRYAYEAFLLAPDNPRAAKLLHR